jgi:hypothetical protein
MAQALGVIMAERRCTAEEALHADAGHATDIASRRSRRAVRHYWFRRQTTGKGRAPQRLEQG